MKILCLHADYIEYEARQKAIPQAPELTQTTGRLEEALAVFVTVEKGDEVTVEDVVLRTTEEIRSIANQVGVTKIMLYPYAHLSSDLAGSETAQNVLRQLAESLVSDFIVHQSPFG